MVGFLHPREQGSEQRFSPVCQRWYSRSSDGVVITHSTTYNAHALFLNPFEQVYLFHCQIDIPHLAGVLDDRTYNCGICFDEMMRFHSNTLNNSVSFVTILFLIPKPTPASLFSPSGLPLQEKDIPNR